MNKLQYAANISHLFAELPFFDRFEAAAAAGFEAVEILCPFDQPAKDIQRALTRNGLKVILFNAPPPNYTGGERGFAAVPGLESRFLHDMRRAIRYADVLKPMYIHVMAGVASGDQAKTIFIKNLKEACKRTPKGLILTIEPLNAVAMPGYYLNSYELAAEVIEQVGAENLRIQYDSYHAQMITGDAVATYEKYRDLIAHIQVGDAPDRTEPGTGTVDFKSLFAAIRSGGYTGWISGEYTQSTKTIETFKWRSF